MVNFIKQKQSSGRISSKEMKIGQTGIIVDENEKYLGVPIVRVYNPDSPCVRIVALNDGNRTWTDTHFDVRLCNFELTEIE